MGIDEKTRRPSRIPNKEEVLGNIHRAASLDCCDPAVGISVEEVICEGRAVFVVTAPHQYESVFSTEGKMLETTVIEKSPLDNMELEKLALYRPEPGLNCEVPSRQSYS
ncbi:MAG: hypothetical protein ACE5OR_00265 [bacterium]